MFTVLMTTTKDHMSQAGSFIAKGTVYRIKASRKYRTGKSYRADETRKIKEAIAALVIHNATIATFETEASMVKSIGPMPSKAQMAAVVHETAIAAQIPEQLLSGEETPRERKNRLERVRRAAKKLAVAS